MANYCPQWRAVYAFGMYVADVWCHDEQVSEAKEVPSIIRQVLKEVKWEGTALSLDVRALKASTVLPHASDVDFSNTVLAGDRWWEHLLNPSPTMPDWAATATMKVVSVLAIILHKLRALNIGHSKPRPMLMHQSDVRELQTSLAELRVVAKARGQATDGQISVHDRNHGLLLGALAGCLDHNAIAELGLVEALQNQRVE